MACGSPLPQKSRFRNEGFRRSAEPIIVRLRRASRDHRKIEKQLKIQRANKSAIGSLIILPTGRASKTENVGGTRSLSGSNAATGAQLEPSASRNSEGHWMSGEVMNCMRRN